MMKQSTVDIKEILNPVSDYLKGVDAVIKDALMTGVSLIDESAMHLFAHGGKRIRASLFLLSSGINGAIPDGLEKMAAAIEIVHAASLIHDDIIDKSILRRGGISVPQKWGNKVAVLAGDYMYTTAMDIFIKERDTAILDTMASGARDMVKGELYQMQFSNVDAINKDHYFNIIELKTANYMGCCAKIGAIMGRLNSDECEQMYQFGKNLGFAFQIIDDNLDVIQDKSVTGKDSGNDFIDGKITLPLINLLENSDINEQKRLKEYIINPNLDNWQIVKESLFESGAVKSANMVADEYMVNAVDILTQFPETECREILNKLAHFLVNRDY